MPRTTFTIGEVAEMNGDITPRVISDLFYRRYLDPARCPVVRGRRMIPADYLPEITRVLTERGLIQEEALAT